ncbi:hypothetical protein M0R89_06165 [Halorussus limi]|uniref:DUF8103 domain-containing protein n=1 Tax=Halorussus limi TaxID=2938695 RepID=A0A8U0HYD5_9EURY|nr:hypothetical protein [Halorussus limi]UPV75646.1 hypothetical protein M0R89_06165 [Halorussus limi]
MATKDITDSSTGEDFEDAEELQWVLAKTLLDANAHSTQALENYLLLTHRGDGSANLDSVQESIRRAIDEHETIIEELELASEAVAEWQNGE